MARLATLALLACLAPLVVPAGHAQADDVAPPEVTSFVFAKATYGPGETIEATLHVTDDTGINSVWFTLRNRDGGLVVHHADPQDGCPVPHGATDVDVTCRLTLPAEAPSGFYEVHQLGTHDTIGHSSNLFGADLGPWQGRGVEVLSSFGDRSGPVISDVQVAQATVQAGSTLTVTFRAQDPSGIQSAMVSFRHVGRSPTIGTGFEGCSIEGTADAIVTCLLATDVRHARGDYVLESASARDTIGYNGALHAWKLTASELAKARFTMESENADAETPKLTGIDLPDAAVPRGGPFTVQVFADEPSGLETVVLRVQTVHGTALLQAHDCAFTPPPSPTATCTGDIPANFPQGEVRMELLYLEDAVLNRWHYMLGVEGSLYADSYTEDVRHDVHFYVGPAPLQDPGSLTGLVEAIDPFFSVAEPGTVLPIVVETVEDLASVTARFVSAAGDALGVLDCALDANQTVIGSLCHLIVPDDAPIGLYVLDQVSVVRPDGSVQEWTAFGGAPSFTVAADAGAPLAEVKVAWRDQTQEGMTLASFNAAGETRYAMTTLVPRLGQESSPTPPAGDGNAPAGRMPPAATASPWPEGGEPVRDGLEEARPAPSAALATTLVALALAARRRAKQ